MPAVRTAATPRCLSRVSRGLARISDDTVSEESFFEALDSLVEGGYIERSEEVTPHILWFAMTNSAFMEYLSEDRRFDGLCESLEAEISTNQKADLAFLAKILQQPPIVVETYLEELEARGDDLQLHHGIGGHVEVCDVSVRLKRRVRAKEGK